MAILKVKFDNILCFNNFEADFTYPKKLVKSTLENEYLENYPKIKYKKVNVLIGSNATGKTSLGKAIWKTFIFINNKEAKPFRELIADTSKEAFVLLDCAFPNGLFFRFESILKPNGDIDVRYRAVLLNKDDSYETVVNRLPDTVFTNHIEALEHSTAGGWNFAFPVIEEGPDYINCKVDNNKVDEYINILTLIMTSFDPSIKKIFKSKEQEDTYIINFSDGRTESIKHGKKLSDLTQLSSGSKYAINIAMIMFSIKNHFNGFYYVDEQFSYVNSDLEIACLNTMIEMLGDGEQLFFTSHNEELMDLPYPLHTFSFLKKKIVDDKYYVELVNASQYEKRNNVNVKNLYDNDYFDVAPNTSNVFEIGDFN